MVGAAEEAEGDGDMKECENICEMPTLAEIEIHQSEETGKIYLEFITMFESEISTDLEYGIWYESKPLPDKALKKIIKILEKYGVEED